MNKIMNKMMNNLMKKITKFFSYKPMTILFIIILIVLILYFFKKKEYKSYKSCKLVEGLDVINQEILDMKNTNNNDETNFKMDFASSFCDEAIKGDTISKCGALTNKNCNATSCCVWTDKCVPGDANGPTFNTDENGKTQRVDYYYQSTFYKKS